MLWRCDVITDNLNLPTYPFYLHNQSFYYLVALYKRPQILIGDTWACFNGEGLGTFKDIDDITMFADYR